MEDKKYNGWTNYETWLVNLWMSNDAGGCSYWDEQAQECYKDAEKDSTFSREERATLDLADVLKAEHEEQQEMFCPQTSGLFADLLNAALSDVDWYEIAEHYIAEVDKEEETEETEESEKDHD